jgi:diguanylate cyclase (GGDEF)-like protein
MRNDPENRGPAPSVLCVTENRSFLNRLRSSLADAGFSVIVCRTEAEARELVSVSRFDVVVLDQALSQTDGLSVWRGIRRDQILNAPPTLIAVERWDAALLSQVVAEEAAGMILTSSRGEEIVRQVADVVRDPVRRTIIEETLAGRVVDGGIDPVTRIPNTSHFARRLVGESVAAYREGHHLAVLMVSIDQYGSLSKRHGARRVDDLLAQAARVIEADLRSRDCAARYSDHVFGIILAEADLQAAAAVGRRLQRTLGETEFGDLDHPIAITVSVGAACRPAGAQAPPDEIIANALKGCAAAEQMGGNRVMADRSLTGRPVALVAGQDPQLRERLAKALADRHMEGREAASWAEAKRLLAEIPVTLLVAAPGGDTEATGDALDLLSWARGRFPATRRILAVSHLEPESTARCVNRAAVHWLIQLPVTDEALDEAVEALTFV